MKLDEIAAFAEGLAPVIRELMAAAIKPLADENAELKRQIDEMRSGMADAVRVCVADAVSALPVPQNGKDADMGAVALMIDEAVKQLPPPLPGKDADPELVAALVTAKVGEAVAALPKPENGKDANPAVIAEMVAAAVADLPPAANGKDADPAILAEMVSRQVAEAVAALPKPVDGKDVDPALVAELVAAEVAKIPPAAAGKDADPDVIRSMVDQAVARIPAPADGKDADPALVEQLVTETVGRVFEAWEKPKDGTSVTLDDVAPLIDRAVTERVALIPTPKDGAPGKLPIVRAYEDAVHYEGDVVTLAGSTYQAQRDTGRAPPHEDWICIAAAGTPGRDAREIEVKGTYDPAGEYGALNIVALNGGAFIARKDDPGPCPGEGWQVIAMRGKPGEPGKAIKGDPGKSIKGDPGPGVAALAVDDNGMLTLVNGDGSTVECDLYPVLSKLDGAR